MPEANSKQEPLTQVAALVAKLLVELARWGPALPQTYRAIVDIIPLHQRKSGAEWKDY